MKNITFCFLFLALLFSACGSDDEPISISCGNQVLAGTFAEKEFSFEKGRAYVSTDRIGINMYNSSTNLYPDVCLQSLPEDLSIFGSFINRTGRIDLGFGYGRSQYHSI